MGDDRLTTSQARRLAGGEPRVVRVTFSDFGSVDDLRRVILDFRAEGVIRATYFRDIAEEYLDYDTEYIDRAHIPTTGGRFIALILQAYLEWCDWALGMVDTWEGDPFEARDRAVAELRRWSRGR